MKRCEDYAMKKKVDSPFCWVCGDEMDEVSLGVWICIECDVSLSDFDPGVIVLEGKKEVFDG